MRIDPENDRFFLARIPYFRYTLFQPPRRRHSTDDPMGPASMLVLTLAAIAFSVIAILISRFVVKGSWNPQKGQAYECGIPTQGQTWIQFQVGYYLFALIFLVFDVELIFLYPWAVVVKEIGWPALVEIVIFLFILFLGFLYAHKVKALTWK